MSLSADNLTDCPIMDAPAHFDRLQCARNINSDGLFEIDVFSCGHDGFQMLRMVIRRSGDYDGVQFLGPSDLLIRVGAKEELRRVDRGVTFILLDFVEVCAGGIELIAK